MIDIVCMLDILIVLMMMLIDCFEKGGYVCCEVYFMDWCVGVIVFSVSSDEEVCVIFGVMYCWMFMLVDEFFD